MSKNNYKNNYVKKESSINDPKVSDFTEVEEVKDETVEEVKDETVEEVKEVKKVKRIKVKVNTAVRCNLNMRERNDIKSDVIAVIPRFTTLEIEENDLSKYFAKVTYNGIKGYCMTEYLKKI